MFIFLNNLNLPALNAQLYVSFANLLSFIQLKLEITFPICSPLDDFHSHFNFKTATVPACSLGCAV